MKFLLIKDVFFSTILSHLDRRSTGAGQYESFRKRSKDDMLAGGRRGSFSDRGRTGYEKFASRSWSPDSYSASMDNFHPVTLTVKSFFKQVCISIILSDRTFVCHYRSHKKNILGM